MSRKPIENGNACDNVDRVNSFNAKFDNTEKNMKQNSTVSIVLTKLKNSKN